MIYCKCKNCQIHLEIDENDSIPECREMEEVYCSECNELVTKVFTSASRQHI